MQGPAIFLAQFVAQDAPFNNLATMAKWAGDLGYVGVQVPTWESNYMDDYLDIGLPVHIWDA